MVITGVLAQLLAPTLDQNGPERRRGHLQRIRAGHPLGLNFHQSRDQQRTAPCEEALRSRSDDWAAGTVFEAASGPWFLAAFLKVAGALGARRGEVLALRWADIQDGRATIGRSLTQTKLVLDFSGDQDRAYCGL